MADEGGGWNSRCFVALMAVLDAASWILDLWLLLDERRIDAVVVDGWGPWGV